jgi:hypothetical protein
MCRLKLSRSIPSSIYVNFDTNAFCGFKKGSAIVRKAGINLREQLK